MKPKDSAYLYHIRDAIDALENIAEATKQLSEKTKINAPQIPWRKISNFRNTLIHEYREIDIDLIWKILDKDIPTLKNQIQMLISKID